MNRPLVSRVILITLDGVGVGALPDAAAYGDAGAHTLGHVAAVCGGLDLPCLQQLGLGNIVPVAGVAAVARPTAGWGRMAELSAGKDTTAGHWELSGLVVDRPFATFPDGFPTEIIEAFRRETGLDPLGNVVASGTEIIARFGEEHLRSGRPILYTSVDSVFQLAAHEEVIPVERLYHLCRVARKILDPYRVGRVIARPFRGRNAADFKRTPRRHDFSMEPFGATVLDHLLRLGLRVIGVGKIGDIYAGKGLSESFPCADNADGMAITRRCLKSLERGLIFANLVDFDMLYGHRRDAEGFGRSLEEFDRWLPELMAEMATGDLLVVTADHGCDPTTAGTDHSREYVPLLVWGPGLRTGVHLGLRRSFADVAATLAEIFGGESPGGESFFPMLRLGDRE